MRNIRWYDKDPEVKEFLTFLQNLDINIQQDIAQDLLQIILQETSHNPDWEIGYLNKNKPHKYERWYDKNANLHSAIELIKSLDDVNRKETIGKIMESTFQLLTEVFYAQQE